MRMIDLLKFGTWAIATGSVFLAGALWWADYPAFMALGFASYLFFDLLNTAIDRADTAMRIGMGERK